MGKILFAWLCLVAVFYTSCDPKDKKDVVDTATTGQLVADSAYLYTKEAYLWNTLPGIGTYESFNPRRYATTDLEETADNVIQSIRGLQPLDHFSFATSIEESDQIQTGEGVDWGFWVKGGAVASPSTDPDNVRWFITYVYTASDAGTKGVKRGWILNKINGVEMRGNQASVDELNDLLLGNTITSADIEFEKTDGTKQTITVNKTKFTEAPILYSAVITAGAGKKVGYLVYNAFIFKIEDRIALLSIFSDFADQGITDLIVDLRYNLGGSTDMQDFLANVIAPASADGTTMYQYEFNQQLQQNNFPLLKKKFGFSNDAFKLDGNTVSFQKIGTLNLSRVFFIVSDNTASASELLINNLKPVMDVKLIGESNTYGKPVGFFPIELFDKVALYPVSFRTINSAGNADYYDGFTPDHIAIDGINKDWGDINDPCLANALSYINTGNYLSVAAARTLSRSVTGNKIMQLKNKKLEHSGLYTSPERIR